MKTLRRICCLTLAILLCASLSVAASAVSVPSNEEKQLISSKTKIISGVPVIVNQFENNGYIVDTYSFADETTSPDQRAAVVSEIADTLPAPQARPLVNGKSAVTSFSSRSFDDEAVCPTNRFVYVRQTGTFNRGVDLLFSYIWASGRSIGAYVGSANPTKITMEQTITTSGANIALSIPPSASISWGSNSISASLGPYEDSFMGTANWPGYSARAAFTSGFALTSNTRADIYFGSTSYGTQVTSSQSYDGSWN